MDYNTGVRGKDKLPTINTIKKILQNIEPYLQWYADNHNNKPIKLVLPLMGCGVGGLDTQKVLELYKSFFSKEVYYQCNVVIYGYSSENYALAKEVCI